MPPQDLIETRSPGYEPSATPTFTPHRSDPLAHSRTHPLLHRVGALAGGAALGALVAGAIVGRFVPAAGLPMALAGGVGGALAGSALLDRHGRAPQQHAHGAPVERTLVRSTTMRNGVADLEAALAAATDGKRINSEYVDDSSDLLPDVLPISPQEIMVKQVNGRRELRFSSTWVNMAQGPLMVGYKGEGLHNAVQLIQTRQGGFRVVKSDSDFINDARPHHSHVHLNDFGRYSLYHANADGTAGKLVSEQHKVSFMITNTDTDSVLAALDPNGHSRRRFGLEGYAIQGMSAGHGDTYGAALAGQGLDITGLPPGRYILRQHFDPNDRLAEENESNNIGDTVVVLNARGELVRPKLDFYAPRLPAPPGTARLDGRDDDAAPNP